jgi:hypothetical protein
MALRDLESDVATAQGKLMVAIDAAERPFAMFATHSGPWQEKFEAIKNLLFLLGNILKAKIRYDAARLALGDAREKAAIAPGRPVEVVH